MRRRGKSRPRMDANGRESTRICVPVKCAPPLGTTAWCSFERDTFGRGQLPTAGEAVWWHQKWGGADWHLAVHKKDRPRMDANEREWTQSGREGTMNWMIAATQMDANGPKPTRTCVPYKHAAELGTTAWFFLERGVFGRGSCPPPARGLGGAKSAGCWWA